MENLKRMAHDPTIPVLEMCAQRTLHQYVLLHFPQSLENRLSLDLLQEMTIKTKQNIQYSYSLLEK